MASSASYLHVPRHVHEQLAQFWNKRLGVMATLFDLSLASVLLPVYLRALDMPRV